MQWLIDRFEERPDDKAFIHKGNEFSYGEVVGLINDYRSRLKNDEITQGKIVCVEGDYSPSIFCLILALALEKNIIIPLTNEAVIERDAALEISGSDYVISFTQNDIDLDIVRHSIPNNNQMLLTFLEQQSPGLILYTSGSTGAPKAILHNLAKVADKFREKRKKIITIPFLMLDHFGGINTILAILSSLGTLVTVKDRSSATICSAIEKNKIELLPTTPSFLTMMLAARAYHEFDLSSLKRITYGTEVMPITTLKKLSEIFPDVILQQTYGLSEVGVLASKSRENNSVWFKIGGPGFETKIVDNILWVKSDYRMVGYLNAPSNFDDEGWFNTEDCVEVDGEYLRILGRTSDLINVGGQKVYPNEIEEVIMTLDNVADVSVYAEANSLVGQIIVAQISIIEPETVADLKKRVRKTCIERLVSYKVPSKVIITEKGLHNQRFKKQRREL